MHIVKQYGDPELFVVDAVKLLLIQGMSFRYQDYRMTPRGAKRLDACIARLVKEGKITKENVRQTAFIGVVLL